MRAYFYINFIFIKAFLFQVYFLLGIEELTIYVGFRKMEIALFTKERQGI